MHELEPRVLLSPFGVASSAESMGSFSTWAPPIAQAGATEVRIFPSWGGIQPSPGTWNWSQVDSILATAANNHLTVTGLFLYNAPWLPGTYPTGSGLSDFATYVSGVVSHCTGSVQTWEVWNEPENFGNVPPADYANLVTTAYNAAKAADPNARIGLSVASVDVVYLEQAILAGAADHFDFIAVHPYESLGTAAAYGEEADFISIVPTLRKMLAADDPAAINVPIRFTEIGQATSPSVSTTLQAQDLVKAYSMAIAEGVDCVQWFEAQESHYHMGLLDTFHNPTPSYTAFQNLAAQLGGQPQYLGWVLNGADYGFVFQGATTTVMATWAPPRTIDGIDFGQAVQIMDPVTGGLVNTATYSLTNAPVLVIGVPSNLVTQAQGNMGLPFLWGGDYTGASSVSVAMGAPNAEAGLHQLNPDGTSTAVFVYGVWARDCSRGSAQFFTADPNFLSYTPTPIQITAVLRRLGPDTAGFNLKYESTSGWKTAGGWYTIPGSDQWYTHTWTITDDEFVRKWGYNFRFDSDSTTYSKYYLQSVTVTINAAPGSPRSPLGADPPQPGAVDSHGATMPTVPLVPLGPAPPFGVSLSAVVSSDELAAPPFPSPFASGNTVALASTQEPGPQPELAVGEWMTSSGWAAVTSSTRLPFETPLSPWFSQERRCDSGV